MPTSSCRSSARRIYNPGGGVDGATELDRRQEPQRPHRIAASYFYALDAVRGYALDPDR